VCVRRDQMVLAGRHILAHELAHLWRGPHTALPILEEGKAELIAIRSFPKSSARMIYGRQAQLRRLLMSTKGQVRGGQDLVQAAMAPSWIEALHCVGLNKSRSGDLYSVGLELALRMEAGDSLRSDTGLSVANSRLLALPVNGP
jgi:hypothetical protein